MSRYDIVLIGSGPGGYTAAIRAAMKGAKVACVEGRDLGGVCLNRGCIPSKALIAAAIQYDKMKRADELGLVAHGVTYDWTKMLARKNKVVNTMTSGVGQLFKSHGVEHVDGWGKVTGRNEVTVWMNDGSERKLDAENIIVATGSRSRALPAFPIDGKRILTSDHLLELEHLPESMLIIGGGVIGCEWASMLSLLDVKVTVLEVADQLLPTQDKSTAQILERELKKHGVKVHTNVMVKELKPGATGVQAILEDGKIVDANQALLSVGRSYNTEDLGLEDVGVKLNKDGSVKTGSDMRTNIKNIYAIGDVRGQILLAYTATHEGMIAVDNCLGAKERTNYLGWPSVIFTHPEIGSVGMPENVAAEDHEILVGKYPLRALGKAHAENEIAGEVKIIGDKKTDKILGVHCIGAHAAEVVHVASAAVRKKMTVTQLGENIFAHPVISEAVMEAAHDVHGMSVHLAAKRR